MVFVNQQHFFNGVLLEAHFIKLVQKVQELGSLKNKREDEDGLEPAAAEIPEAPFGSPTLLSQL